MFQRSMIAGLGLMGTSLALALRKNELTARSYGFDINADHARRALDREAVDRVMSGSLPEVDFIALCTPIEGYQSVFEALPKSLPAHIVIVDVASVKRAAIDEVFKYIPEHLMSRYVPCHPIAGAASYGPDAADADLFDQSTIIITPTFNASDEAMDRAKLLWKKIGATTRTLSPEKHDRVYAYVSHLPQLLAWGFLLSYHTEINPSGLERFLRIGGSSPKLWESIFMHNRDALLLALDEFQLEMHHFSEQSSYDQIMSTLKAVVTEEYKVYAGPGFRDFISPLPLEVRKNLPKNGLMMHHILATFHSILHDGDIERLDAMLRKAKAIHNQCFI